MTAEISGRSRELDELMRVPDSFPCGHVDGRDFHTLVESLEPLISPASPHFGEADFWCNVDVFLIL